MAREARSATTTCYIDTSALLKRYLRERGSDEFEAFCDLSALDLVICPLGAAELTSSLQRRIRMGLLTKQQASAARQNFLSDVASGSWQMIEFGADIFSRAQQLMLTINAPLATLDALHLAAALQHGADEVATADHQLAEAARKLKLHVHVF